METKSPIYAQAKEFAEGVHAVYPDKWLAYNVSRQRARKRVAFSTDLLTFSFLRSSRRRSTGLLLVSTSRR